MRLARLVAFSAFTSAAFSWSWPWLDRPGLVALGLACLSLSVGRSREGLRPSTASLALPRLASRERGGDIDTIDLAQRLKPYGTP